ncbi:anaphase-promoting complex component apc8 [Mycoemilia scoparia]|uniref:Anaphase-promoting complex component apc8 n=1 Tax=Mycoemilia scoparia TaxID=417184 RepID=A0A9W8DLH2_9FUNG|nr:anaphase-promoting complex component apc8 [Mycoemilia scoparia]
MGHEYMEMKNTSAAIQAYRRAIEVDERDYRAWYGLGQTYEMLKQPQYAFYYFKRAAALRPFDSRMWCALANCYEMSGQIDNAIACYERALCGSRESEQIATSRLGRLYESIGKDDTAAHYYKTLCDKIGKDDAHMEEISNALIFLARHQQKLGQPDVSEQYLRIVIDAQGPQTEAAKAMLRAIRSASTNKSDTSDRARPPNRAQLS